MTEGQRQRVGDGEEAEAAAAACGDAAPAADRGATSPTSWEESCCRFVWADDETRCGGVHSALSPGTGAQGASEVA